MRLAATLAQFSLSAQPDATSAEAEAIMRLSLYDWIVCGLAGAHEPVSGIVRDAKHSVPQGKRVFGESKQFAPADAALINGATSHALDYDDTHFAHIGHPSVAVFPTAFAAGGTDEETIWAALVGAEVSVRVGQWLGRNHYQTGFHQTATAGAFGATAAAGRLMKLNAAQMQVAFGVAATQAAGLKSQFGTMGKPYHAGLAARTGIEAATLARAGFDTRGQGIDGPQGFGPTHHGEGNDAAFEDLGSGWRMETVSHKFHACCHGLHAMLEALTTLDVGSSEIEGMRVTTHPRWLSVCNIQNPNTGLECKFSYRHTAAMAILGRSTAALDSYSDETAHDPALVALRGKVVVETDDHMPETAAHVHVQCHTQTTLSAAHDLDAPIAYKDRAARLRRKGQALLDTDVETRLWQATHANRAPDMDALHDLMCF